MLQETVINCFWRGISDTFMRDYNVNIILSTIGTALGISIIELQNILGLILTVINLFILVVSLVLKLIRYIKNDGKLDKEEISDLLDDVEDIKDSIEKEHKDGSL